MYEMDRLTETGKSTPFPNMSDEDLSDYERWEWESFSIKPLYNWDWWLRTKEKC